MNDNPLKEIVGLVFLLLVGGIIVNIGEAMGWAQFGWLIAFFIVAGYVFYLSKPWRERRELKATTQSLKQQAEKAVLSIEDYKKQLGDAGINLEDTPEAYEAALMVGLLEGILLPSDEPDDVMSIEHGRYRDRLKKSIELGSDDERYQTFVDDVIRLFMNYAFVEGDGLFQSHIPLSGADVEAVINYVRYETDERSFPYIKKTLSKNLRAINKLPTEYRENDLIDVFFRGTPFTKLRSRTVRVDLHNRTRHTMILGGSGTGKTNLLEFIISKDLLAALNDTDDASCVIVIDSQRQLIPKLSKLPFPIENVTYLNPAWDGWGLNLFDVGYAAIQDDVQREAAVNNAVGLIRFVLEGALQGDLSDRQRVVFDYAIQLIITIPGGNIVTFMSMLEENGLGPYHEYIAKMDAISQNFFMKDWGSGNYKSTLFAIKAKLQTLLKNPTFKRLFSATKNSFSIYDEMQSRWLVLLDTDKPLLDKEASSFLGRLYIAMIMQAAYRRFESKGRTYKPVYLVVDEAHEYFDDRIAEMLEQARKANIGVTVSHQDIDQIKKKPGLTPATVIGSTATKLVATTYQPDAVEMAKSMLIKPEDILNLPDYTFGLYDRHNGFVPVRADEEPLAGIPGRDDPKALQKEMIRRYGAPQPGLKKEPEKEEAFSLGDPDTI